MIEFRHVVSVPERKSLYLNLKDEAGNSFGDQLPCEHKDKVRIVDGEGRATLAQKHNRNQIWGGISRWFRENNVLAGAEILVRFDLDDRDIIPVIHLIPESAGDIEIEPAVKKGSPQRQIVTGCDKLDARFGAMPRLRKLMSEAVSSKEGKAFNTLEHYLLGVVAYECKCYREAALLMERALADGLDSELCGKAQQLRSLCRLKIEEDERRSMHERLVKQFQELVAQVGEERAAETLENLIARYNGNVMSKEIS